MIYYELRPYFFVILGEIPLIAALIIAMVVAIKHRHKSRKSFRFAVLAFASMLMGIITGMTYSIFRLAGVIQATRTNLDTFAWVALASGVIRQSLQTAAWVLIILALFNLQRSTANHPNA